MELISKAPTGPIETRWDRHRFSLKLVNPANKRKHTILVVGSGLAGASAAASLAELGYQVQCFCFQDSPRRAHSIAAQGGINAAGFSIITAPPDTASSSASVSSRVCGPGASDALSFRLL